MNWTIFFAIIILAFIFWKPAIWLLKKINFLIGTVLGIITGINLNQVRRRKNKGGDKYDVSSNNE